MVGMESRRRMLALGLACGARAALSGQVIEFESGGLRYQTQTRNGVTVMFAHIPLQVRQYAVIQVAISNGSQLSWPFKAEDFRFVRADGVAVQAESANAVVLGFMERGGREDVVKLVSTYELGLYGLNRLKSTNGYESRRRAAMAEVGSPRLKAAATASAIVLVPVKLKPGESTDGALFYPNAGKPLGSGKMTAQVAGATFEFDSVQPAQ